MTYTDATVQKLIKYLNLSGQTYEDIEDEYEACYVADYLAYLALKDRYDGIL